MKQRKKEQKARKISYENKGEKIAAALHVPSKKSRSSCAIILAHGFTGDKDTEGDSDMFPLLAENLCKRGFHVLRIDFRGSGESDGKFEDMTISGEVSDLQRSIEFLKEKGFEKIGVVGGSLGGCVTLLAYAGNMDCMVLWYPAIFPQETKSFQFMESNEKELLKRGKILYKERYGRKYYVGKNYYEERKVAKPFSRIKDITCPFLIVAGDKDASVPFSQQLRAIRAAREPKKLEVVRGADHCFKDKTGKVRKEWKERAISVTVDWFNQWLK